MSCSSKFLLVLETTQGNYGLFPTQIMNLFWFLVLDRVYFNKFGHSPRLQVLACHLVMALSPQFPPNNL